MRRLVLMASMASALSGVSCSDDNPCDPGYIFAETVCKLPPLDAAAPTPDAQTSASDSAMDTMEAPAKSSFGDPCTVDTDCTGDTDYCAAAPGAPKFCSTRGCDKNPGLCPSGWTCFDATAFGAGHVCLKP